MKMITLLSDSSEGGAAIACRRLRDGLVKNRLPKVEWIVAKGGIAHGCIAADGWPDLVGTVALRVVTRLGRDERRTDVCAQVLNERNVSRIIRENSPCILNMHNIHEAMSFRLLDRLPQRMPIVWTLHDIWPLTGYCCYGYECKKYLSGCCGNCPQLGKWGTALDVPETEWGRRERFFSRNRGRVVFIAPSRWLSDCARRRFGGAIRVECIPYGLDLGTFKPISRIAAKEALGLGGCSKLVLAGSQSVADTRKGTEYLTQAVKLLKNRKGDKLGVVVFGSKANAPLSEMFSFVGSIRDEQLLNLYYNAADVFVLPSLADNLPNTLLEATAAGTPCVTFDVGGCPEIVRHGETGFVAKYADADDLAACIERVLSLPADQEQQMRKNCRRVAEQEYSLDLQASRYAALFEELVDGKK